jgi:hypothetical protein
VSDDDPWIRIATEKTDEGGMTEAHPLQSLGAVYALEEIKLKKEGFKVRAGEPPADAADESSEMEPPRMARRGLEQASQAELQIGRAADVGLGARVCAFQREDRGGLGKCSEDCFGISQVVSERLPLRRRVKRSAGFPR